MEFQVDPASCVLAVIALLFAWQVERRNTRVILRILECQGHSRMSVSENRQQMFHEFRVLIKNIGINLHNPTVHLSFDNAGGLGNVSIQLHRMTNLPTSNDEFVKGMIAEFTLKSYQLDTYAISRIVQLTNFRKQNARLVIKSQDYIAAELPLDGLAEDVRGIWNRWAFKINRRFWRESTDDSGQNRIDTRGVLPEFKTLTAWPLKCFVNELRRDSTPKSEAPNATQGPHFSTGGVPASPQTKAAN